MPGDSSVYSIPSLLATAPSCFCAPRAVPSFLGSESVFPRPWRRESPERNQPRLRGRSEQVTARRGPGPRWRPYLLHVGRQLAPGVVVPDVELHVYVHDARSPGPRRRRPRPRLERRLPPARPRPVGGARGRPRASHGRRPRLPHGQGSRQLGAARATGHRSSGDGGQRYLGSSKFLPSFTPPEMALGLRHFRPLARGRRGGAPGWPPGLPFTL